MVDLQRVDTCLLCAECRLLLNVPDAVDVGGRSCLDVQVQPSGFTAYMVACRNGNAEAVGCLLGKGCSTALTSNKGLTGWDLAVSGQQHEVCSLARFG